ncbi:hypothetical protein [Paenibacillus sp. SI8]|uniref:hypothetical protein n=1 Tax=unclassified Paenibacillus TaxID=185978 RepID=UPI003465777F
MSAEVLDQILILFSHPVSKRRGIRAMTLNDQTFDHDDELLFADEEDTDSVDEALGDEEPWVVLIVDDEKQIHQVTKMVLLDFEFDRRKLEFHSAYSAQGSRS